MDSKKPRGISIQSVISASEYGFNRLPFFLLRIAEKLTQKIFFVQIPKEIASVTDNPYALLKPIRAANTLREAHIIRKITRGERMWSDIPRIIKFRATSPRKVNNAGFGESFFSEEQALWRAIAECTERQLWREYDFYSKKSVSRPYSKMKNRALNIFSLAGFSKEQKEENRRLQFSADTPFLWTKGFSLTQQNAPLYIPVQLVSAGYSYTNSNHPIQTNTHPDCEPMLRWCVTTGLATGTSLHDALVSGILEVIERDAFMILHLNKLIVPRIDLDHLAKKDAELNAILKKFRKYNLTLHALELPTDFNVYAYVGIVTDESKKGPAIAIGASADTDMRTAIIDSLSEAFAVYQSTRHHFGKDIDRNDPSQFTQDGRLVYWAKPENTHGLQYLFDGPLKKVEYPTMERTGISGKRHSKKDLSLLTTDLKQKNLEAGYVELTSKGVRCAGMCVVKVVIPELIPLHLHEILPYQGGNRITQVPETLGYTAAAQINTDPHPFP